MARQVQVTCTVANAFQQYMGHIVEGETKVFGDLAVMKMREGSTSVGSSRETQRVVAFGCSTFVKRVVVGPRVFSHLVAQQFLKHVSWSY